MSDSPARSIYRGQKQEQQVRDWCVRRLDHWTLPHRREVVPTCAGATHVVSAGSGSPTVVVVPGTNESAALLEDFATALTSTGSVLLADLPGQPGLSAGRRPGTGRLSWYGRWLADLLDRTVPDQAIVVGHSLGGAVALACDSPRIAGRVLVSPAGLVATKVSAGVLRRTIPWLLAATPARSTALLRHFLAPGHAPAPELVEWYTLVARACRSSLAPPALPSDLLAQRTTAARLVVTGRHDGFFPPERLRDPAGRVLDADLSVLPDAGHLGLDEQPQALAALVHTLT
ncbi:alpha/beta fold hydrolase [Amycolatopsis jiangsuensis]|uniref:Pimeloyl-ACP methyl ester carboxylesterase n=1 Tax=Amycolatopsis jiangsuensis TaxID=1181879 RepID=A0A840IYA3_9PSEU|nr:alpha/beta hydrolase [Amycolatopsis jiangsuensis]MBB4687646.1 pimeloyl-ACP methyl ester carboxylesterase [Amycolatopsis jiangsuensis]